MREIGGFLWPDSDREAAQIVLGQSEQIDAVARLLKRRRTAIQAGGNVGIFPKRLNRFFGRVYTFEPDPENYACLQLNLAETNVTSVQAALGAATGSVGMELSADNVGSHRVAGAGSIPMTTIDAYDILDCDLIWLDVEGYELEALKGAVKTIEQCRPVIVVEDFGLSRKYGIPAGAAVDWLVERGYRNAGRLDLDVVMVPAEEYPAAFIGTSLDRFSGDADAAIPLHAHEAAFNALGTCLSFSLPTSELSALRLRLLGDPGLCNNLCHIAAERDMLPILDERLRHHGLVTHAAAKPGKSGRSLADFLEEVRAQHAARRAAMRSHLSDAIAALNRIGIEPLLLKGAVSLWRGAPGWRQMRDLDLLVDAGRVNDAANELSAIGFHSHEELRSRDTVQHIAPFLREGFPGWLELHIATANRRGMEVLPSSELERVSGRDMRDGMAVRLLPAAYDALHGLVHNHFSHRSSSLGTINLKGLYEFSAAVNAANDLDRRSMLERAAGDARLQAAFDFWIAAAARFYRFELPAGWSIREDADARAAKVLSRAAKRQAASFIDTLQEEAGLALNRASHWSERLRVLKMSFREVVAPWRDRGALHDDSSGVRKS